MAKFQKGDKKPEASGRKKGTPNKVTRSVKEVFSEVFNKLQEDPNVSLEAMARKDPKLFYSLATKLIPTELDATIKEKIITVTVRE